MKHMFVLLTDWLQWHREYMAICNLVAETTDRTKRLWFSCKKTKKESSARGLPIVGKRKKIGVRRWRRVSDRVFLSKGSPQSACEACKIKSAHTDLIEATEDEKVQNRVRKHSLGLRKRRWREDKKEDAVYLQPVLESSRARPLERAREKRDTRQRENEKRQERCDVMLRRLKRRELGATPPRSVATHVRGKRARSIELASHKEIVSAHNSGINSLQVPLSSPMNEAGASIYLSIWYIEMLLLSFLFFFLKSFFKMFVFLCCDDDDDDDDPWRTHWLIVWLQNKRICLFVCLSNWRLQIDGSEARYLLAGASDGSVGVYDTQKATTFDSITHTAKHEALFTVDKSVPQGHMYSVSSVQWYPVDTGLFVTGSFDNNINLWDTNTLQVPHKSSFSSLPPSLPLFLLSKEKTLIPQELFSQ